MNAKWRVVILGAVILIAQVCAVAVAYFFIGVDELHRLGIIATIAGTIAWFLHTILADRMSPKDTVVFSFGLVVLVMMAYVANPTGDEETALMQLFIINAGLLLMFSTFEALFLKERSEKKEPAKLFFGSLVAPQVCISGATTLLLFTA